MPPRSDTELVDHIDLNDLIARYAHAVDARDVAGVVGCFAPDATLSANGGADTASGRDAIEAYFIEAFTRPALGSGSRSSHILTNSIIVLDRDRAEVVTLGLAALAAPDSPSVRLRGLRYTDSCQRLEGKWLIADRAHEALWQCDAPGGVV
jgi:uncharacterized protein (TIGR02246 family)